MSWTNCENCNKLVATSGVGTIQWGTSKKYYDKCKCATFCSKECYNRYRCKQERKKASEKK